MEFYLRLFYKLPGISLYLFLFSNSKLLFYLNSAVWLKMMQFIHYALFLSNGVCFNCNIIERIRELLVDLLDFEKSQSFEILSHSVPGIISSSNSSATHSFSAFLKYKNYN